MFNDQNALLMIPKKIHLCWFSPDDYPVDVKKRLESWQLKMPDFETRIWTASDARSIGCAYVDQAIDAGFYDSAASVVGFYALYHEGGFYLDCDVEAICRLDRHTPDRGFTAFIDGSAPGLPLHSSVMIGERGNRFCGEIIQFYQNRHFKRIDGSPDRLTASEVLTRHAAANGYVADDRCQLLDESTIILPSKYVVGQSDIATDETLAMTSRLDSWRRKTPRPKGARRLADAAAQGLHKLRLMFSKSL